MIEGILTGIFANGIYEIIKETSKGINSVDDDLIDKIYNAIVEASKCFFDKFNDEFGKPNSSFLARQSNIEVIVKSMFYDKNSDLIDRISPKGFDGSKDLTNDALLFFVNKLKDAMMKDFRLNKIIVEKGHIIESRETSEKILDTLNTLVNQEKNQETTKEESNRNWIMKDEQGIEVLLEVAKIRRQDVADKSSRVYEILLRNHSSDQVIPSEFEVIWRYEAGICCSIATGVLIKPVANYIIELPLDVHDYEIKTQLIDVIPTIMIPPKNNEGPSATMITVQLHYKFIGRLNFHPRGDWNIYFDLNIVDHIGRKVNVFSNYVWRTDEDIAKFNNGYES